MIIVLTPAKNEAWILDLFLSATSQLADHIIVADQNSTDNSFSIYKKYKKVVVLKNESNSFNEAERQTLLINKARELFGLGNILLALDADEVISSNSINHLEWKTIRNLPPGTILHFEKPDLFISFKNCIRYEPNYPLGFVDDGSHHKAKEIHSIRLPQPIGNKVYKVQHIKIVHYGLANMRRQKAKVRFYSVIEAVKKTKTPIQRREAYDPNNEVERRKNSNITLTPPEWFRNVSDKELEKLFKKEETLWYNYEILQMLRLYGCKRFWADKIWDVDWKTEAKKQGFTGFKIDPPPIVLTLGLDFIIIVKKCIKKIFQ